MMPDWKKHVAERVPPLLLPAARAAEIREELAELLEDAYDDARASGASHDEAFVQAAAQLPEGAALARWIEQAEQPVAARVPQPLRVERVEDRMLRSRWGVPMNSILQDVKYALRMLVKSPGFTVIAVVTLALGIGANTAIFTVVNEALLRPRPGIGQPERLVDIGLSRGGSGIDNMSYPNFKDARERTTTLESMAALMMEPRPMSLGVEKGSERVFVNAVSGNYFDVLRVTPHAGRFFTADEDRTLGTHPVVVLSYAFWQQRFAGDRSIVGREVKLNGAAFTVVGVASREFRGTTPLSVHAWLPMMMLEQITGNREALDCRRCSIIMAVGRLKPGVSLGQARAEFQSISESLQREYPKENEERGIGVLASRLLPGDLQQYAAAFLGLLMAIVGLVLVIAAVNVAGMMLVRAAMRRREIAVRLAIGAARGHIIRQLVTEGVLVFAMGGALGLVLAVLMRDGLVRLLPELPFPVTFTFALDWRVFTFALAISLLAGIAASLLPALQASRPDLVNALKDDSHSSGGRKMRLRHALVLGQVALSLLLLVCAGLFLRALGRATAIDPGFEVANLHVLSIDLSLSGMQRADATEFAHRFEERVRALPGVSNAAWTWAVPLDGGGRGLGGFITPGKQPPGGGNSWDFDWNVVTPGYFAAMKIPLLRGRDFTDADNQSGRRVAIINETAARAIWPGEDPIGKKFDNGEFGNRADAIEVEIIGVARDHKYRSLGDEPRNFVYVSLRQWYIPNLNLMVRSTNASAALPALRTTLLEMNPNLPILSALSMQDYAAVSMFPQRVAGWVSGSLGLVGLLLVGLGVYGVTAFSVAQRTREIGVRIALGATRSDVLQLVLVQGLRLTAWGVVIGLALAAAASQLLVSLLYGVGAFDPVTFIGVAALVLGVAALATLIPARRATRVDPLVALRTE